MAATPDTISGGSARQEGLGRPMEAGSAPDEGRVGTEGEAAAGDGVDLGDGGEVAVGERLIRGRPEALRRLKLGRAP